MTDIDDEEMKPQVALTHLFRRCFSVAVKGKHYYVYQKGVYHKKNLNGFRKLVAMFLDSKAPNAATKELIYSIAENVKIRDDQSGINPPYWFGSATRDAGPVEMLVLQDDCVLDFGPVYQGKEPKQELWSPTLFAISKVEYGYDQEATCPKFDKFMEEFTCGDKQLEQMLVEFFAYCILLDLDYQKMLILSGSGQNGKSVYLKTLRKLLGKENCSAVKLERLSHHFAGSAILGKRVNIDGDTNQVKKLNLGILKELTSQDAMEFEQKYEESETVVPKARHILACNRFPHLPDRSDGTWRRLLIVECRHRVPNDAKVEKLQDQFNYSGILNRVIAAAKSLVARGHFDEPESVQLAREERKADVCPEHDFFQDKLSVRTLDEFVSNRDIYSSYVKWCEREVRKPLSAENLGQELREYFAEEINGGLVKVNQKGKADYKGFRANGIKGLVLNTAAQIVADIDLEHEKPTLTKEEDEAIMARCGIGEPAVEEQEAREAANNPEIQELLAEFNFED